MTGGASNNSLTQGSIPHGNILFSGGRKREYEAGQRWRNYGSGRGTRTPDTRIMIPLL